jgi:2-polyprenyl-3-methyl-5-hydroxy-6-metoxy-1,4-benzoquinol methylase
MAIRDFLHIGAKIRLSDRAKFRDKLPLTGYREQLVETKFVDPLSDADLISLNNLMNWNCFTVDSKGRRFGNAAWAGKRCEPQAIPDRRILLMNEWFGLADKHVLEVGCFEGIHTVGLSKYAYKVTAFDSRIENVVRTIVRCALFGFHPTVFKCNIEEQLDFDALSADLVHHVGVLYHLIDPVRHLLDLGKYIRLGIMLDTHYSLDHEARESYSVKGKQYHYKKHQESGYSDVFSGMYAHSKWLTLDDITELLRRSSFKRVNVVETRSERNGPRALILAQRD